MPFLKKYILYRITLKRSNINIGFFRKGLVGYCGYFNNMISWFRGKASASALFSYTCSGSVTVEAVLCIPLFLYAAICLIWMLEIRAIQIRVRCALQEAGKELAIELVELPILSSMILEEKVVHIIEEERIARSLIDGEIECKKSFVWPTTGIMELKAEYRIKLPVPYFVIPKLEYEEGMRIKIWNGYRKSHLGNITSNEKIVYVTDTGVVYHEDYHCNYLELSVRSVSGESLAGLRNESGEKYRACLICGSSGESYYITSYGNRYHSNVSCVGLKRNIYAVPISEVKGKGACSKCGS